jgi:hypothetical protein
VSAGGDEPAWTIDSDIRPDGWNEELREVLASMHQGRLVADPPIAYYATQDHPLTHTTARWAERKSATAPGPVAPRNRPPWGIVTTQTCDLIEEGAPKRPWFTVAPVYVFRCAPGTKSQITQGRGFAYLFAVTMLGEAPNGLWVADLRLEVPVEKGWLIGRRTQEAFATQREYFDFAERLAHLRSRFAYPRDLDTIFLRPCLELLKVLDERYGIRIEPRYEAGKDREDPNTVRLVLIFEEEPSAEIREDVLAWWVESFAGEALPLHVAEPLLTRYADLDPRDYEMMKSFSLPSLSD